MALFQSVTAMAPGASVVFGFGLIMVYTGIVAPFARPGRRGTACS